MDKQNEIISIWKSEGFISQAKLKKILKEKQIYITNKELNTMLKEQKTAQLHKKYRSNQKALGHIISYSKDAKWQMDLIDMSSYGYQNNGYKWILIAIDIFTRKGYAQPLKNKGHSSVTEAFNELISQNKPLVVMSDNGSEFINTEFKDNLEEKHISQNLAQVGDHHALGIIDRFIRTIKERIYKHFTDKNTTKWIDVLPSIIQSYNNQPHGALEDIKPNDAPQNEDKIVNININKAEQSNELENKINVGDKVRYALHSTFKKGYEQSWSDEILTVLKVYKISAILSDNKKYKISNLQKIDNVSEQITIPKQNIIQKEKKHKKVENIMKKLDMKESNIIETKRVRKPNVKFTL